MKVTPSAVVLLGVAGVLASGCQRPDGSLYLYQDGSIVASRYVPFGAPASFSASESPDLVGIHLANGDIAFSGTNYSEADVYTVDSNDYFVNVNNYFERLTDTGKSYDLGGIQESLQPDGAVSFPRTILIGGSPMTKYSLANPLFRGDTLAQVAVYNDHECAASVKWSSIFEPLVEGIQQTFHSQAAQSGADNAWLDWNVASSFVAHSTEGGRNPDHLVGGFALATRANIRAGGDLLKAVGTARAQYRAELDDGIFTIRTLLTSYVDQCDQSPLTALSILTGSTDGLTSHCDDIHLGVSLDAAFADDLPKKVNRETLSRQIVPIPRGSQRDGTPLYVSCATVDDCSDENSPLPRVLDVAIAANPLASQELKDRVNDRNTPSAFHDIKNWVCAADTRTCALKVQAVDLYAYPDEVELVWSSLGRTVEEQYSSTGYLLYNTGQANQQLCTAHHDVTQLGGGTPHRRDYAVNRATP
jgi:hypothetical protein